MLTVTLAAQSADAERTSANVVGLGLRRWRRDPALPTPRTEITRFPHAVLEVKLSLHQGEEAPEWIKARCSCEALPSCPVWQQLQICDLKRNERAHILPGKHHSSAAF
jgi:hypothetical protein